MKNIIRLLSVFFLLILLSPVVFGQTEKDSVAVLQKCVELKDLQQFLPLKSDGTIRQLYILQHGVSFPANTNVMISGKKIVLVNQTQLEAIKDPYYLLFWDFRINQNMANAGFVLNNKTGENTIEQVRVIAEAEKKGTEWVILDFKIIPMR